MHDYTMSVAGGLTLRASRELSVDSVGGARHCEELVPVTSLRVGLTARLDGEDPQHVRALLEAGPVTEPLVVRRSDRMILLTACTAIAPPSYGGRSMCGSSTSMVMRLRPSSRRCGETRLTVNLLHWQTSVAPRGGY